jgi:hypothetical protein
MELRKILPQRKCTLTRGDSVVSGNVWPDSALCTSPLRRSVSNGAGEAHQFAARARQFGAHARDEIAGGAQPDGRRAWRVRCARNRSSRGRVIAVAVRPYGPAAPEPRRFRSTWPAASACSRLIQALRCSLTSNRAPETSRETIPSGMHSLLRPCRRPACPEAGCLSGEPPICRRLSRAKPEDRSVFRKVNRPKPTSRNQ